MIKFIDLLDLLIGLIVLQQCIIYFKMKDSKLI